MHAKDLGCEMKWPTWLQALEIKIQLAAGNMDAAIQWERSFKPQIDSLKLIDVGIYLSLARVWIAENRLAEACALLKQVYDVFPASETMGRKIETLVLLAIAHRGVGEDEQATSILEEALVLAEPEGFVRVFFDEGPSVIKMLKRIPFHSPTRNYAIHLLLEFARTDSGKYPELGLEMTETLSAREIEVLCLLETSMDSRAIARQLVIAVSTTRTHIRNIYAKLGVNRRMEAIQRARELGLL
jgi:LuxR family maltose regulon positive regulatory protein